MSMHMNSLSEHHQMMILNSPTRRSSSSNKLQGPRPAALKVSKSSSKIRKKPVLANHDHLQRPSPVVIYLVSPKIIHVRPEEFMGLVQRLTGKQATSSEANNSTLPSSSCSKMEKNNYSISTHREVNYAADQQAICLSSSPSKLAAYSSLCIDIWDDF